MTELREHRYLEVLYGFRIQIKSRDWAVWVGGAAAPFRGTAVPFRRAAMWRWRRDISRPFVRF